MRAFRYQISDSKFRPGASQTAPGVIVLGRREHGRGGAFLDDLAPVHHGNAVAHLGCDAQIVRDEQHPRLKRLRTSSITPAPALHRDIERRTGSSATRISAPRERARDADTLALSAGELMRKALQRIRIEPDETLSCRAR